MISGIYAIYNCANGKFYIGSAVNLGKRIAQHKSNLKNNRHPNKYIQYSYNKYGDVNFQFLIIEICNFEKTLEREQWWLDITNAYNRLKGYNARPKAESNLGKKTPEDVKLKLSLNSGKRNWDLWPHVLGSKC